MAFIKVPKGWEIPESLVTPEDVYLNRRHFIKTLGFAGLGAWGLMTGCLEKPFEASDEEASIVDIRRTIPGPMPPYPAVKNPKYTVERAITQEEIAASYNNFYEFTSYKKFVWRVAEIFETQPWKIEVTGNVHKPRSFDIDDLIKLFPLEERVYRHRCVEAWSMVVPWVGFAFQKLIDEVQPTSNVKHVRMVSFYRPGQAIGQRNEYPWPYYEALTMEEATNELTMIVTGLYGHALPNQHGAPIRLITPWKYGYKSIKSLVKIEFVDTRPPTFWNDLFPQEYGFEGNVNPKVPHPNWSQATERVIDTGERIPTVRYNGYGEFVAHLYES